MFTSAAKNLWVISGDGLHIAFDSFATNLVDGDANGLPDVFIRNLG